MKENLDLNFGLIIAFLLPGFIFLYGLSFSFESITAPIAKSSAEEQTVGTFLFTLLASLALGLLISALRWMLIDTLHRYTGVKVAPLRFEKLKEPGCYAAFLGAVDNHYRYYQYYANSFVAVVGALIAYIVSDKADMSSGLWILILLILAALFFGSRDALKKYNERASAILK